MSAAALRLGSSRLPLITGLATDVAGVRAAVRLAEAAGGVIDHGRSAALYSQLDVLRRTGLFRGVPAELRRRADRVLLVGGDALEAAPDLLAYLLEGAPDLGRAAGASRGAVWIGGPAGASLPGVSLDVVAMEDDELPGFIGLMRASLGGRRFDRAAPAAGRAAALGAWLAEAKFAIVVWSPGLDSITVETLTGLVSELNAATRASAVPLGEAGEAHGAAEVATWLSGYPLRVSFARGEAEHDPLLFESARLLGSGECDLALHVDARAGVSLGPIAAASVPVISIASAPPPNGAAIAFEVAPAGAGRGEALWDDRLASFTSTEGGPASDRPSAADVLSALADALAPSITAGRAA